MSYEQKLKALKNKNVLLVQVIVKGIQNQLQVHPQTTVQKIINRYIQNGYYQINQKITEVQIIQMQPKQEKQDEEDEDQKDKIRIQFYKQSQTNKIKYKDQKQYKGKKVSQLLDFCRNKAKRVRIKLYSAYFQIRSQEKRPISVNENQLSSSFAQNKQSVKIRKFQSEVTITFKQLQKIIGKIFINQCEQKYRQFERVIRQKLINRLRIQQKNKKADQLESKSQIFEKKKIQELTQQLQTEQDKKNKIQQGYNNFVDKIKVKLKDLNNKILTGNQNLINQQTNTKKSKQQKWGQNQLNIFNQIQNLYSLFKSNVKKLQDEDRAGQFLLQNLQIFRKQLQKDVSFPLIIQMNNTKEYSKNKNLQIIIQEIKQISRIYTSNIKQYKDQYSTLQQTARTENYLSQKNMSSSRIQIKTSCINEQSKNQIQFISQQIRKYENRQVQGFQVLFTLRRGQKNQISFANVVSCLDSLDVRENSKLLFIIKTHDGNCLAAYSTRGIYQGIKQNSLDEESFQNKIKCGFLLQAKKKKVFRSLNLGQNPISIIKYTNQYLMIGNLVRIQMMNLNKKLQIQIRPNKKNQQLQDKFSEIQNLLNGNKRAQIEKIQVFGVNLVKQQRKVSLEQLNLSQKKKISQTSQTNYSEYLKIDM